MLIIGEYDKYLAAWIRPALHAVYPSSAPAPATGTSDALGARR